MGQRAGSLRGALSHFGKTFKDQRMKDKDPLALLRQNMAADEERLRKIESEIGKEVHTVVTKALEVIAEQAGNDIQ